MALIENRELNRYVDQELRSFGVAESARVFRGAFVGIERESGCVRNLSAGDQFAGVAYEEIDNTTGLAGDRSVRVYTQGDFVVPTSLVSQAIVGAPVYAADSESTTTQPGAGASFIGVIMAVLGASSSVVRIMPVGGSFAELAVNVPLVSSTSAASMHAVLIPQRAIRVISAQVSFRVVPDQGNLDVGVVTSDPDEMVDAFALSTLTANTPVTLTLADRSFEAGVPLHARVGQASSTAGQGGMLSIRYVELP
ncbi:MAG: hypothetical protein KF841_11400 [Phycisphaerae bacterium]|nr:hypothetical protein [Phycisphaerae bacterium]